MLGGREREVGKGWKFPSTERKMVWISTGQAHGLDSSTMICGAQRGGGEERHSCDEPHEHEEAEACTS